MANVNTAVLTYEDYRNAPDDERHELLEGELVLTAAPNLAHQKALFRMARLRGRLRVGEEVWVKFSSRRRTWSFQIPTSYSPT